MAGLVSSHCCSVNIPAKNVQYFLWDTLDNNLHSHDGGMIGRASEANSVQ